MINKLLLSILLLASLCVSQIQPPNNQVTTQLDNVLFNHVDGGIEVVDVGGVPMLQILSYSSSPLYVEQVAYSWFPNFWIWTIHSVLTYDERECAKYQTVYLNWHHTTYEFNAAQFAWTSSPIGNTGFPNLSVFSPLTTPFMYPAAINPEVFRSTLEGGFLTIDYMGRNPDGTAINHWDTICGEGAGSGVGSRPEWTLIYVALTPSMWP
jgi:hypothetical protein